jgi:hypothetical protein
MASPSMDVAFGRPQSTALASVIEHHDKKMKAGLSTQVVIKVQGYDGQWYTVGAIQRFQVSEARNLVAVQEVGTDGVIQLHPSGAQPITIQIERCVFDYQRITVAFQRSFQHIMNQRFPFDICVLDYNPYLLGGAVPAQAQGPYGEGGTPSSFMQTRFVNCWFESMGYSYESDNYQIRENASCKAETVYSTAPGNVQQLASSGLDIAESAADTSKNGHTMIEAYATIPSVD